MSASFFRRHRLFFINLSSASSLLVLGDFFVQIFYEKKKSIDTNRQIGALATGAAMGIQGHIWYNFLDRIMAQATWRNVFKKVILDQTIAAPIYTATFIVGTSVFEGRRSSAELNKDIRSNFLGLYLADCLIFIPTQIINFKYIPAFYRVPFMYLIAFFFDSFLSAYKHAHPEKRDEN